MPEPQPIDYDSLFFLLLLLALAVGYVLYSIVYLL